MVEIRELDFLVVDEMVIMDSPCCTTVLELEAGLTTEAHASKRA
jgi:hypothetical protein